MKKILEKKWLLIVLIFVASFLFNLILPKLSSAQTCYQNCLNAGNTPSECSALCNSGSGGTVGEVNPPPGISSFSGGLGGISVFINAILKFLIVVAGIYAVFNFVLAGYGFMSAGDDPKKVAGAWAKIWQTVLGLAVAAGSLVIAAIVSWIIFGDPNAILQIRIFGPQ